MENLTISVITPKEESRIMRVSSEFLEGKIKVGKN